MAEQLPSCSSHVHVRLARSGTHACPRATQLVNYPAYRDHEVKAMWEWLRRTGRKLEVIGMMGPLQQVAPRCRLCIAPQTSMLCGGHTCSVVAVQPDTGRVKLCFLAGRCCISSFCPAFETAEARRCNGPQPAVRPGRLPAISWLHCVTRHAGPGRKQLANGNESST